MLAKRTVLGRFKQFECTVNFGKKTWNWRSAGNTVTAFWKELFFSLSFRMMTKSRQKNAGLRCLPGRRPIGTGLGRSCECDFVVTVRTVRTPGSDLFGASNSEARIRADSSRRKQNKNEVHLLPLCKKNFSSPLCNTHTLFTLDAQPKNVNKRLVFLQMRLHCVCGQCMLFYGHTVSKRWSS